MNDQNFRLLITRSAARSQSLIEASKVHGIKAFAVPMTKQVLTEDGKVLPEIIKYRWVFFTSATAVNFTAEVLKLDLSDFAINIQFAAVGDTTAKAIGNHFKSANIIADHSSSAGLADSFINKFSAINSGAILWICAENPAGDLLEILTAKGYDIEQWRVYKTISRSRELVIRELEAVKPWDAILFAAPSAVDAYTKIADNLDQVNCIALGDTTARALAKHSFERITVCPSPHPEDVISAVRQSVE